METGRAAAPLRDAGCGTGHRVPPRKRQAVSAMDGLPPLREVISAHGLWAKKSLGQNFIMDLNLTARIARTAGDLTDSDVLEIGPGPGGLTRGLLAEGARRVLVVEKDRRCLPALRDIAAAYPDRVEIVHGDALETDPMKRLTPPIRVIANLPYNVGTRLLTRWLSSSSWPPLWSSLTLMFQREVAQRIVAKPGEKAYGRLSVFSQWRCDARIAMELRPEAFTPQPRVRSSVVQLAALPKPRFQADAATLERVVAKAFGQRRKMLRTALSGIAPDIDIALEQAGLRPTDRAEEVSLEGFCALARRLAD